MNSPVACSSVISRTAPPSAAVGRRMKRSIFCGTRISAFIALPSLVRASWKRDREAEIGNERKRMRRIDRERRQHREDVVQEIVFEPGAFGLLQAVGHRPARCSAALSSSRSSRQRACWSLARLETASPMRASCSLGVSPSGLLVGDARAHLALEAGDAHHEEFIEVVGRDRQEPHLLQQRMLWVLGLLQHAAIEMQPGQLAVDEALGAARQIRRGLGRPRGSPAAPDRPDSAFKTMACARFSHAVHDRYMTAA